MLDLFRGKMHIKFGVDIALIFVRLVKWNILQKTLDVSSTDQPFAILICGTQLLYYRVMVHITLHIVSLFDHLRLPLQLRMTCVCIQINDLEKN